MRDEVRLGRREVLRLLGAGSAGLSLGLGGCEASSWPFGSDREAAEAERAWARAVAHVEGGYRGPGVERGHRWVRQAPSLDPWRSAPAERVEVAVVGGGVAGLSAARRLRAGGVERLLVLELEPREGGTSVWGEQGAVPHPWGAHYLPVPMADNASLVALLEEMGVLEGRDEHGQPLPAEEAAVREPEERLFHQGVWYAGLYPYAGASRADLAELRRFRDLLDGWVGWRDGRGRRAFALPRRLGSDDAELAALDRLSATDWLQGHGFGSARLRWLCEYACRDDYGLTASACSAWALLFYWASRTVAPGEPTRPLLAWPEGNGALVRFLGRGLGGRLRRDHVVAHLRIAPEGRGVTLFAWDAEAQRARRIEVERVVLATPLFVAHRLLRDAWPAERRVPDVRHAVWLVANVHLRDRPRSPGVPLCWDNVLYDSPSVGYVDAGHQAGRDHGPTVWTYYLPLVAAPPREARRSLLELPWEAARDLVLQDLARAHPVLLPLVERLDVYRWGHAMPQARPGLLFSPALRAAARPLGPVHFAHSDLSGVGLFEEAFDQGLRAAEEVLAALRPEPLRPTGGGPAASPAGESAGEEGA